MQGLFGSELDSLVTLRKLGALKQGFWRDLAELNIPNNDNVTSNSESLTPQKPPESCMQGKAY